MKNKSNLKILYVILLSTITVFIISKIVFYISKNVIFQFINIAALTTFLHFSIRIIIGQIVKAICKNIKFNYNSIWFKSYSVDHHLYNFLHIKNIKNKMISANPYMFDIFHRRIDEVLHYMTVAEIVHEISFVASYVPCLLIFVYGSPEIFIITSVIASIVDLLYVFIQRYNRPRLLEMMTIKKGSVKYV